jgi:hypothetical protein
LRLIAVERGHRLRQKLKLYLIRLVTRRRVVDIIRTLLYRPEVFGAPMSAWTHEVMRGPSEWSVGERELFATFASSLNRCRF